MRNVIYFDNAATTFPKEEIVYQAMDEANRGYAVNAGRGSYALATKALERIAETRKYILELADANNVAEVVFTASATLACNQILGGITWKSDDVVYVSPFEHNAVMRTLYKYQKQYGFQITELAVDKEKLELDLEKIKFQFTRQNPSAVVLSHVSNVTGYILPLKEVALMAKEYEAIVIADGAQALGIIPISLKTVPIDFYIFAGHKTLYGPFGIGGFIKNTAYQLSALLAGGTGSDSLNLEMPKDGITEFEPGSPNIVSIAGLHASLIDIKRKCETAGTKAYFLEQEKVVTEYLIGQLQKIPEVTLYLPENLEYHAGIIAFNVAGYQSADVGMILDQDYNIAVRTGYQCAPLVHKYLQDEDYKGIVRASLGRFTAKNDADKLAEAVRELAEG